MTFVACSRCHTLALEGDRYCAECGHELRVPPHLCSCARCYRQLVAIGEPEPPRLDALPLFGAGAA